MPSHQNHNDSVHRKAIHFIYYENEAKWVSTASDKPWFIVTTSHHITCIHIHQHRYTAKPPFNQIIFVVSTPEEIGKHAMYRFSSRNFDLLPMETYAQCSLMVHQEREVKKKKKDNSLEYLRMKQHSLIKTNCCAIAKGCVPCAWIYIVVKEYIKYIYIQYVKVHESALLQTKTRNVKC